MTDFRDALLKAGLVDKDAAARAEADERARQKSDRRRDPRAASVPEPRGPDDDAAAAAAVERGHLPPARGPKRFYVVGRDDRIRWLDLPDPVTARLERGDAGLVEAPDGTLAIVDAATARELARVAPGWLRAWTGGRG